MGDPYHIANLAHQTLPRFSRLAIPRISMWSRNGSWHGWSKQGLIKVGQLYFAEGVFRFKYLTNFWSCYCKSKNSILNVNRMLIGSKVTKESP
jgi:hypothetical protein